MAGLSTAELLPESMQVARSMEFLESSRPENLTSLDSLQRLSTGRSCEDSWHLSLLLVSLASSSESHWELIVASLAIWVLQASSPSFLTRCRVVFESTLPSAWWPCTCRLWSCWPSTSSWCKLRRSSPTRRWSHGMSQGLVYRKRQYRVIPSLASMTKYQLSTVLGRKWGALWEL